MSTPQEGKKPPAISLPDQNGETVKLASLKGRRVLVYFYPKADTPGCTREAIDFSRLKAQFAKAGAEIVGVSADPVTAQDRFKTQGAGHARQPRGEQSGGHVTRDRRQE